MSDGSIRRSSALIAGAVAALAAGRAAAQVPYTDPTPDPPAPAAPARPPRGPTPAPAQPGFTQVPGQEGLVPAEESGFYHYEDYTPAPSGDEDSLGVTGPVPETHV